MGQAGRFVQGGYLSIQGGFSDWLGDMAESGAKALFAKTVTIDLI